MAIKQLPRPCDPIQLGELIGDILTGQVTDAVDDGKDPAAEVVATTRMAPAAYRERHQPTGSGSHKPAMLPLIFPAAGAVVGVG